MTEGQCEVGIERWSLESSERHWMTDRGSVRRKVDQCGEVGMRERLVSRELHTHSVRSTPNSATEGQCGEE